MNNNDTTILKRDTFGNIIEYNGFKISYRSLRSEYPTELLIKAGREERILTVEEVLEHIKYKGLGYEDLDLLRKRVMRLRELEEDCYRKSDIVSMIKLDYTDYSGYVLPEDFKHLMRRFTLRLQYKHNLKPLILNHAYNLETNSVGNWGMHTMFWVDTQKVDYYAIREELVKLIVDVSNEFGGSFSRSSTNFSEPVKFDVHKSEYNRRNRVFLWSMYLAKMSKATRAYYDRTCRRLFNTSHLPAL